MKGSKKKSITIGVIVACLVAAAVITYVNMFGGGGSGISADATIWMKCSNPDCQAEYEISEKEYYEQLDEDAYLMGPTPVRCKKCGKDSAYRAIKCEKCGTVFVRGTVPHDFVDRCPKCGYSKMEETRKEGRRK